MYDDHPFFDKCPQFNVVSRSGTKKKSEKFLLFKIVSFEPGGTNSHNREQDTSHWQSICYQATLRFEISLKQVYCKAGSIRVMKNIMKVLS